MLNRPLLLVLEAFKGAVVLILFQNFLIFLVDESNWSLSYLRFTFFIRLLQWRRYLL